MKKNLVLLLGIASVSAASSIEECYKFVESHSAEFDGCSTGVAVARKCNGVVESHGPSILPSLAEGKLNSKNCAHVYSVTTPFQAIMSLIRFLFSGFKRLCVEGMVEFKNSDNMLAVTGCTPSTIDTEITHKALDICSCAK